MGSYGGQPVYPVHVVIILSLGIWPVAAVGYGILVSVLRVVRKNQ